MRTILRSYPARVRIGLVLILLFAATSSVRGLRHVASAASGLGTVDEITRYEARYEELKRLLPAGSVVGYLSDPVSADLTRADSRTHFRRYVLTQYALAPSLVSRSTEADLVVGNFESPESSDSAAALQLTLVRDFGDGLMLFRRAP